MRKEIIKQTIMNNNIQESYCSFEVSKLLKEKEFDLICRNIYSSNQEFIPSRICLTRNSFEKDYITAPTHALAIEWIRVNFDIHIHVEPIYINIAIGVSSISGYSFYADWNHLEFEYSTPQEATEAALLYTLTNLIPNKDDTNS